MPTKQDRKKYVLKDSRDWEILKKCRFLQKKKLKKADAALVKFILSQLEDDWRKPLLVFTNKLVRKYKI